MMSVVADELSRTPPAPVRLALRREVGFGCPAPNCRVPFLQYHHFDPPWEVRHHHEPGGMIPLCALHHGMAEAFTDAQLREFKKTARDHPVSGRFEWLRRDLVGAVGGNLYHETPILVQWREHPVIWFNRDEAGNALLNVNMLKSADEPRVLILDNDIIGRGEPVDFECPPSGRMLRARYANGDYLRIEFKTMGSANAVSKRLPGFETDALDMFLAPWPNTFVFVTMYVGGQKLFGPTETTIGNMVTIKNSISSRCGFGLHID
jgi:hypothetical protein